MQNLIGASQGKRRRIDWSLKACISSCNYEDRLSVLPDEALTRILGMIPTKDAAVLTVLSPKLLPAFSLLTNLEFDDSPISHCIRSPHLVERTRGFKQYVDYVLRACQSKQLGRFTLRFGRFCRDEKRDPYSSVRLRCGLHGECHPSSLEPARLASWISFPLARGVRELDLCINVKQLLSPGSSYQLPASIFVCETLEMLKIDSNLDLNVDDVKSFPICLPRLKQLHFHHIIINKDEFVTKLVESCTVLQDLLLYCWWELGDTFAISSPSLLKLDLRLKRCRGRKDKHSTSVIIQTPNVQYFKYWDNLAHRYFVTDLNALVQADISICFVLGRYDCLKLCSILKSCSAVSHLTLQGNIHSIFNCECVHPEYHLPVFYKLNHLELVHCISPTWWSKVLVDYLEHSPCLQTLSFPEGVARIPLSCKAVREALESECQSWRTSQANPSCCNSHLKRIVINKFVGLQCELALIQFLLKKAIVLESLDIFISKEPRNLDLDPVSIQSELHKMPRASTMCSITVL